MRTMVRFKTSKRQSFKFPTFVLVVSLIIGYFLTIQDERFFSLVSEDIFEYVLIIFLFVMGLRVSKRMSELSGKGSQLIAFALITPIVGSLLALGFSYYFGLGVGNATLLMVLTASASYIAVPAVVKDAIPNANPAIYLGLSLGVTFPFNIIVGIPLYNELAKYFIG